MVMNVSIQLSNLHGCDVSAKTMFVEEMETLGLHEDIFLLDVVETDNAAHHWNVPGRQELSRHLDELEHDGAAGVLLAPGLLKASESLARFTPSFRNSGGASCTRHSPCIEPTPKSSSLVQH